MSGLARRIMRITVLTAIAAGGATAAWALPPETGGGTATPYGSAVGSLTIEGLQGQSTGSQTMTIYGYGIGVKGGVSDPSGGGSSRAKLSTLSFVKHLDPSSPGLFAAAVTGLPFKSARADINGPGGSSPFMSYCLRDARVASDKQEADGTSTSAEPLETVELSYSALSLNFTISSPFNEYVQRLGFGKGGPKCANPGPGP